MYAQNSIDSDVLLEALQPLTFWMRQQHKLSQQRQEQEIPSIGGHLIRENSSSSELPLFDKTSIAKKPAYDDSKDSIFKDDPVPAPLPIAVAVEEQRPKRGFILTKPSSLKKLSGKKPSISPRHSQQPKPKFTTSMKQPSTPNANALARSSPLKKPPPKKVSPQPQQHEKENVKALAIHEQQSVISIA